MPLSPLAPAAFPDLPVIDGVTFAAAQAGVKYKNRTDVMLAVLAPGSTVTGVFTRSATRSAPVLDCQAKLGPDTGPAAILVNSGNSNAFTGKAGLESVAAITQAVAAATGIDAARVFTASTGVIGEPLPHDRIVAKIDDLKAAQSATAMTDAARAIMTTDTFPKGSTQTVTIDGKPVQIAGIAKGSGMIAPDMATMLVYIFTDAQIAYQPLQDMLGRLTDKTFNNITVDSDTSTSDSLMLAATGTSGVDVTGNASFEDALHTVMLDLAHQVVRDGEGATKFVTIAVTGAETDADARLVAMATANSPLVKTAIAGEDPNWGRIVMAVGKSGAAADRDKLTIKLGDMVLAENGWRAPSYSEEAAAAHMKGQNIDINVDLGLGDGAATVWTCDLTHEYITINADYRS
ncbi:MAG: bifunctional glutamate N-acetyltransferase/amino-acid acetyltransferase ArgJ [Alphaproteobacteria bacterium]|jgi:glutamate N-acetyltransferase/amino-acid N-acetyltransferase|uniref:bifunctional glutamate N-acetyltransferase/amino-acid acetyltransferase ArgJ n=1 Tax=Loktanella salsilacus TaxID=195913 RepID=UPI001ED79FA3|nr:bifunctional glutamate N-acetyltransferase/amino-acid acetyltransferase ArgJ [Loktanella salsilacus]MBU0862300.1 bifunctional glutamate N-acetyltransferase/amino-acid acetyltransferase ArgJ [Alphaproteobacteria bacterium]UTH44354.1 bifunctional glutamate N-acetyltransferase/amino-acid acetyltransferase ArgJ [Loktanella salsilacus]